MTHAEMSLIAENPQSTVVAEYMPSPRKAEHYQTEADLEREFIAELQKQAYEYIDIRKSEDLVTNLRKQLEKLNRYTFSDNEWRTFFETSIANAAHGIEEKTYTLQEDYIKILRCDDGEIRNIYLLDKKDIHNNSLQVINQYATGGGRHANRYDVTILVNGLPLVHVELKKRGIPLREAFRQIDRYQKESFWADSGLFEYIQIFVISNGTQTKYYSNTTRFSHVKEQKSRRRSNGKQSSNSFEFTSWWSDYKNQPILELMDFVKTFFAKHTILHILTKYCVFTTDRMLLVMRPYQIVATETIINKLHLATNYKKYGTKEGGGYVWHTTGSGKTLTSFKTSILASKLPFIEKVIFVVDRKDLDYQTMKEYDKFQKGAANSNTNTNILKKQLEDPKSKIIITTIQKLDRFIKKNGNHEIFGKHVVLIFDECHRSQFGDMHKNIIKHFKKYHIFGFTGTPIFPQKTHASKYPDIRGTDQTFGERLHTYTIVDAIRDKNVLPFRIEYFSTFKEAENIEDENIANIDREKALSDLKRITNIVKYILEHFDQKTQRNIYYELKERRLRGFNSIFAVSSIEMLKLYYQEFQKQLADVPSDKKLKIATIFSYGANEAEDDGALDENSENTDGLDMHSRHFLERAITDYNAMFGTSYDTSAEKFQNYYKDVSQRTKDREIDILLVVNMFLTGFDATTLNTLWVDKNLQSHGLIQAFSRTNRILNSVKQCGNIVCFRNLEQKTNDALATFGDQEAKRMVLLRPFEEYYHGYLSEEDQKYHKGYRELVEELQEVYPIGEYIASETKQREFVRLYSQILRLKNILEAFDQFENRAILSERDFQDYHSMYIDLYHDFRQGGSLEKANINDDLIFEIELIKQIEVNMDYILELIKEYHKNHSKPQGVLDDIHRAIESSIELRNKKDLIEKFIASLGVSSSVEKNWHIFVEKEKKEELEKIIQEENLKSEETYKFVEASFKNGEIHGLGTEIMEILPRVSIFGGGENAGIKKSRVLEKLIIFFHRFFDISNTKMH